MLLGVDLVGQLLVGFADLIVLALLAQEIEDLVLGNLHAPDLPRVPVRHPGEVGIRRAG